MLADFEHSLNLIVSPEFCKAVIGGCLLIVYDSLQKRCCQIGLFILVQRGGLSVG